MSRATRKSAGDTMCAAVLLLLAGCQASQDPAKAGFFDGVSNLTNGTYESRARDQDAQIKSAEQLKADMKAQIDADQVTSAELNRQIAAAQAKSDKLSAQIGDLKRQLAAEKARLASNQANANHQQKLLQAQQRLDALDHQQAALHGQIQRNQVPSDASMQQVEQEIAQMKDSVRNLAVVE